LEIETHARLPWRSGEQSSSQIDPEAFRHEFPLDVASALDRGSSGGSISDSKIAINFLF
jgi:hypothetical protein